MPSLTGHYDLDEFLAECLETFKKKGHDYRQGNDSDLLHNFRTVGQSVDERMEKVWFTYFYKHFSALVTYIKEGGQSESEPIEGRVKDMIVYLLLFYKMVQEAKHTTPKKTGQYVNIPVGEFERDSVDIDVDRMRQHVTGKSDGQKRLTPSVIVNSSSSDKELDEMRTRFDQFKGILSHTGNGGWVSEKMKP